VCGGQFGTVGFLLGCLAKLVAQAAGHQGAATWFKLNEGQDTNQGSGGSDKDAGSKQRTLRRRRKPTQVFKHNEAAAEEACLRLQQTIPFQRRRM
jgi:hypothetical protein